MSFGQHQDMLTKDTRALGTRLIMVRVTTKNVQSNDCIALMFLYRGYNILHTASAIMFSIK